MHSRTLFKCNSILTSSVPLILTSNVGVPSYDLSGAPSIALKCSYLSAPSSKNSSTPSLSLYCGSSIAFKENIKVPIKVQH